MLRVYALFPASLYLLFSSFLPFSPSFIHSPQSFALFLFLLYPLYPFFILLFLLNSPLAFSLPLQFRVICAYIRPFGLYIISTLPRYCHSRKNLFFRKKKRKKGKKTKGSREERSKLRWFSPFKWQWWIITDSSFQRSIWLHLLQESMVVERLRKIQATLPIPSSMPLDSWLIKIAVKFARHAKGGFGLSTGKRVQPPPRLYFRWVESGTMIMAFVLYARFLLGHNSTISNKRDASDLILVYLQGLDLLPSLLPTATKHRLLWLVSIYVYIHPPYQIELPCIYLSPRWRFWQGYLPFDVYTLRPWRDSSLRVVRHRGPWIVLVLRESCQTRPKERPHVARIVLARAAIYCVFEIMQSSGCRLPPRWLLCTSIPLLSLFLFLFPPNPLSPLYLCT